MNLWLSQPVFLILFNGATSLPLLNQVDTFYQTTMDESDAVNNIENIPQEYEIDKSFLSADTIRWDFVFPDIGNLLSVLNIPGYRVYILDFNSDKEQRESNIGKDNITTESEKKAYQEPEIHRDIIKTKHNQKEDSINRGKCQEETTTTTNYFLQDTTTNKGFTTTSDYDYENYGSIGDRNYSPALIASMLG